METGSISKIFPVHLGQAIKLYLEFRAPAKSITGRTVQHSAPILRIILCVPEDLQMVWKIGAVTPTKGSLFPTSRTNSNSWVREILSD